MTLFVHHGINPTLQGKDYLLWPKHINENDIKGPFQYFSKSKSTIDKDDIIPSNLIPGQSLRSVLKTSTSLIEETQNISREYYVDESEKLEETVKTPEGGVKLTNNYSRKQTYNQPRMMQDSTSNSPTAALDSPNQPSDNITEANNNTVNSFNDEEPPSSSGSDSSSEEDGIKKKSPFSRPNISRNADSFRSITPHPSRMDPYQSPRTAYYRKQDLQKNEEHYERFDKLKSIRGQRHRGGFRGGGRGGGFRGSRRGGKFDKESTFARIMGGDEFQDWGSVKVREPPPSSVVLRLDSYGHEKKVLEDGTVEITEPTPTYKTFTMGIEGKKLLLIFIVYHNNHTSAHFVVAE